MFVIDALNRFYEDLSATKGMSVVDFHSRRTALFSESRLPENLNNYRLGKDRWKKLRDEIIPVSRFLEFTSIGAERIRFPLDSNIPDCWLFNVNGENRGIEVTIERGRERYHLTKEMIENGIGRGFIGVSDDAPQAEFDHNMSEPRSMYSTEQALDATKAGILRCLSKKNHKKYSNTFYLLIDAHLSTLPKQNWSTIKKELSHAAASLPFAEIYVTGNAESELRGFQIK